jgi:hypothetical protein
LRQKTSRTPELLGWQSEEGAHLRASSRFVKLGVETQGVMTEAVRSLGEGRYK